VSWVPAEISGFVGNSLTFVAFAYPVRRWVIFRAPPKLECEITTAGAGGGRRQ
jgi:hypothetical protein